MVFKLDLRSKISSLGNTIYYSLWRKISRYTNAKSCVGCYALLSESNYIHTEKPSVHDKLLTIYRLDIKNIYYILSPS